MNSIKDEAPKALTVKQPWAWAIVGGGKDVENRSRATKYRGQIYIHSGKSSAPEALDFPAMRYALSIKSPQLPAGLIIGAVDIIDCHHWRECRGRVRAGHMCSEWAMPDHYHWVLANPQAIEPFPAQGKLGLWNVEVPR